jgi:N-acetyl-anhydromuramyl-L-alanine amidase AmpD
MTIKKDLITINFTPDGMKEVRGICLHSMWGTYLGSIAWFKNPDAKASAHYCISAEGEITQCVLEKDMAWHAGIIDDVAPDWVRPNPNWYTIGIELEDKRDPHWPYPIAQREALKELVTNVMKRYSIPFERVVLHKNLNPSRRSDPVGDFSFDWLFNGGGVITDSDLKNAITLITAFKTANSYGNLESAVRALLGFYADLDMCKADYETFKKDAANILLQSVQLAISKNNVVWQSKVDSANQQIAQLQVYKAQQLGWGQLLGIFFKKLLGYKGGEA